MEHKNTRAEWWTHQPLWLKIAKVAIVLAVGVVIEVAGSFVFGHTPGVLGAANSYLTISLITREALRILENNLTAAKLVNREYNDKFGVDGAKIGTTLNVRKPPKYAGRTGQAMSIENAVETQVAVTLDKQFGVDLEFSSQDLLLSIDDFAQRFLQPAVSRIANEIDTDVLLEYDQFYNHVGTPGTTPTALLTYLQAGVRLNDDATPMDGQRSMIVDPLMEATIVDALKGLFQQATAIAEQYTKGQMGTVAGFDWYMDQNVPVHTVGALGGTPLVNGASQTGSTLDTDGWTATTGALAKGDIFTIANVNKVNPISKRNLGKVQQFRVTAAVTANGSGEIEISIDPPITTSGPNQTVNAAPANNAAITVVGAASTNSPQGLALHKDAITLVSADLPLPRGVDMAGRMSDKQLGVSIRLVRQYDIRTDYFPCRLDVLYGVTTLRAEFGCRVSSGTT